MYYRSFPKSPRATLLWKLIPQLNGLISNHILSTELDRQAWLRIAYAAAIATNIAEAIIQTKY